MNYKIEYQPMICASVSGKKFVRHQGTKWLWLVADQPNSGDDIYVWDNLNTSGFGGRHIDFTLTNDTVITLKGPWHSNSISFFDDTGIDIRDKHLTFGVISRKFANDEMIDVLHQDEDWTIGPFNRIPTLAKEMANNLREKLYYFKLSQSGSSRGPVEPDNESR